APARSVSRAAAPRSALALSPERSLWSAPRPALDAASARSPGTRTGRQRRAGSRRERVFPLARHGIVAGGAERMAARQPLCREPAPADEAVTIERLGGIIRAGGQEPAGSPETGRNEQLVASNQAQGSAHRQTIASGGRSAPQS